MDQQKYTYRAQLMVLIGAGILLLLLFGAWIHEATGKEWRSVQKEYARLLGQNARPGQDAFEGGVFQVDLPEFKRSDRCISCHHGLEDTAMVSADQPHTMHPGDFLKDHPVQRYGCTICHGGQPGALNREEAFGRLPGTHWPFPLLEQPYIQASCGKCHLAIFESGGTEEQSGQESQAMEGMEVFQKGLGIFAEEGCLGCHQARGLGGILGPDLTQQGEKTKHEYSFQNIAGEQSISNWLKEHFKDPEMVSPGSQMLRINLPEDDLEALATFVMGLARPDIPFDYFSLSTLNEFKGQRAVLGGADGFSHLCSACHGKEGEGKSYQEFKTGIPAIGNPDFLRVVSEDFIRFTMEKGRSLRQMSSWAENISGLRPSELDEIAGHLKKQGRVAVRTGISGRRGNQIRGAGLYDQLCRTCHGKDGSGGVALALNQEGLMNYADEEFILQTLLRGRGNAGMPDWNILDDQELSDILAHVASWQEAPPANRDIWLPEADREQGALSYHFLCSRCHGEFGEGETGPAIINRDFLEVASDRFLYETIARGRSHTAMFGWSTDLYNQEKLDEQDISNIIAHMRSTAAGKPEYIYPGSNPGDHRAGAGLFREHCAECHGQSGEGLKAPALDNQELLSASSNGYLMATITLGRGGTAMPSWGYGQDEYPKLSGEERQDLVAYLRSLQRIQIKF